MERWKKIKGYEDYMISNQGRVFKEGSRKFLKPGKGSRGYLTVNLWKNGVGKSHTIHRLVALAFLSNVFGKRTINHIDGIKTNNFVENLEWNTHSENNKHAYDAGLKQKGSKHGQAKLSENQVLEIRRLYATGDYSYRALGKMFGVDHSLIGRIILRKNWTHI